MISHELTHNTAGSSTRVESQIPYPGATTDLIMIASGQTDNIDGHVNTYSGPVWVKPADKRGNPVSNKIVTFTAGSPISLATPLLPTDLNVLFFGNGNACPGIPTRNCPNLAASLHKYSDSSGAYAGVILGNTDNTHYPIIASITEDTLDSDMLRHETAVEISQTFDHFSRLVSAGTTRAYLSISGIQHLDENGQRIDAGLAGVPMATPLETMVFVHEEIDRSKGAFKTKQLTSGKVNYSAYFGGGSVPPGSVTASPSGTFATILTPGVVPGLNKIEAHATATVLLESGETKTLADATTLRIWGVKPEVVPNQEIYVNSYGYPEADTKLGFTVSPADYQGYSRYLIIYEDNSYMGFVPADKDFALLSQGGAKFDIRKKYTAQLVLNWGTKQEIKSSIVPLNVTMLCLIPDYDHNRRIDYADRARALKKDKYYFWVNDDDGNGDTEGTGIPETRLPTTYNRVNRTRDLVDWFPVQVDLSGLTSSFAAGSYTYRLKNADGSLSLVLPWLASAESGKYLTDVVTAQNLSTVLSQPITATGLTLDAAQMQVLTGGKDVILLEAWKPTQEPLVIEIRDPSGSLAFTSSLNLSMAGVEQMFRHKNLIQAIRANNAPPMETGGIGEHNSKGGEKDRVTAADFDNQGHFSGFDGACDDKYVVWLHGANVNGQDARGWHAEMFKRFYWAGSKARFLGISWYSFDSQSWDFYPNVVHAFETAKELGPALRLVVGNSAPVTIMAHSLGNMLISSYLADHYALQVPAERPNISSYLLLNAAVALEAFLGDYTNYGEGKLTETFDESIASNQMAHSDWYGYQKRFGASEWHQLFEADDGRRKLTWRNRFATVPTTLKYVNFYSGGEDVLASYAGTQPALSDLISFSFGLNSWVLQEKWKGHPLGLAGSKYMGWGFNLNDEQYYPYVPGPSGITGGRIHLGSYDANNSISNEQLKTRPFFQNIATPSVASVLFTDSLVDFSTIRPDYNQLMAYAIPALTTATGGWEGAFFIKLGAGVDIIDMNLKKDNSTWPRREQRWNHSDIKDVAFPFVYKVINELAIKGALQ